MVGAQVPGINRRSTALGWSRMRTEKEEPGHQDQPQKGAAKEQTQHKLSAAPCPARVEFKPGAIPYPFHAGAIFGAAKPPIMIGDEAFGCEVANERSFATFREIVANGADRYAILARLDQNRVVQIGKVELELIRRCL